MASMLTCYAEKRACYSLISYKTKKTQSCTDRSGTKIRTVRVRRNPSLRETGCWKSSGLPLAPTEVECRYEPFESGRTRLYTKGILLGYLLYIRRARDGARHPVDVGSAPTGAERRPRTFESGEILHCARRGAGSPVDFR